MPIDWFTVGAQALNFVILIWLLKRFLYRPVTRAIDAREKRIAEERAAAAAARAEAETERAAFQHKNAMFDQQRAALLSAALEEANAERRRLLADAHAAAETLTAKRLNALRDEAASLKQTIAGLTQTEVFAIARKTLRDLADTSLEERLADMFVRRLRAIDGEAKSALATAIQATSEPATVRTAFELTGARRAAIQDAFNEIFAADIEVRFETSPEPIGGIELAVGGQKLTWSIAGYLSSLETGVGALLEARARPDAAPEEKAKISVFQEAASQ